MTDHDIVITGGRVMDPATGLDAVRNVGIKGEKITAADASPAVVETPSKTRLENRNH